MNPSARTPLFPALWTLSSAAAFAQAADGVAPEEAPATASDTDAGGAPRQNLITVQTQAKF